MSYASNRLNWADQVYELVPVLDKGSRSKLRKFNDPVLDGIREYKYKPLGGSEKKIRLLILHSGARDGPDIRCELVEASYDNQFHVPMVPSSSDDTEGSSDEAHDDSTDDDIEDPEFKDKWKQYKDLQKRKIKYEALSWCWGTGNPEYAVLITERNGLKWTIYKKRVRTQLALALNYLRLPNAQRTLWIDAICINQDDPTERNHQVQMMSRVYTRAEEVCIWLGDGDQSSKLAIDFIRHEIMELRDFDALSNDKKYNEKWKALLMLMQRHWFHRRWVVQEIALANDAKIYCGEESIRWNEFAVAVELFVEVETATHRLSEIMQKDEKFRHIPGWFEYVSELGASLLVQATGKVFRAQRSPLEDKGASARTEEHDEKSRKQALARYHTIDPLDRRSLLSLEFLVSSMFIFQASEPRDTIYSMLAIARDAAPFASSTETIRDHHDDKTRLIMTACESFLEEKPFTVDYRRPYADVCKDFIHFVIERKAKLDPTQALDILCRPWALQPSPGKSVRLSSDPQTNNEHEKPRKKSGVRSKSKTEEHKGSQMAGHDRSNTEYWENAVNLYRTDFQNQEQRGPNWEKIKVQYFPNRRRQDSDETATEKSEETEHKEKCEDNLPLPSWVALASEAPISLDYSPGIEFKKTGRANADPLVGNSIDGHRNYSAAQTQKLGSIKFRRRPRMGHYSLYVKGFVLDEIDEVLDASQGGNIPRSWLDLAGWDQYQHDPPSEFWRTLVADRGRDNRNPPYYYARACRESVNKGGISSGRVDTAALINNERNSIVAEFCRRVHAVIWNRRLFKTKNNRLGLAKNVDKGDQICILFGCTVPVVLRKQDKKSEDECMSERFEDQVEMLKRLIQKCEAKHERKEKYYQKVREKGISSDEVEELKKYMEKTNSLLREENKHKNDTEQHGTESGQGIEGPGDTTTKDSEEVQTPASDSSSSKGSNSANVLHCPKALKTRSKTYLKEKELSAMEEDPKLWYKFNGECYLHGMMDGEAIRERLYQEIEDRTFELR